MKNKKKNIFNLLFLAFVFGLTFYGLFRDQELVAVMDSLRRAGKGFLLLGLIFVIIYVCSESVIIYYMMNAMNKKVPLKNCIKYSFIGFFFSCITPSATGGQPAQIYYMNKENISIPVSTLVLMIVTIGYKFVLVIIGIILLIVCPSFILAYMGDTSFFLYLGLGLNIACVSAMLVLVFEPTLAKKIMIKGLFFLEKLRLIKQKQERMNKLTKSMDKYHETAAFFKSHKLVMLNIFLISMFQRICLFYVTYLVYRAFGFHEMGALKIIALQAVISIAVDMLPLPGGMGASENLFLVIFRPVFGKSLILSGLLLSRGISYYALLIMSALVTCYAHFTIGRKTIKIGKKGDQL